MPQLTSALNGEDRRQHFPVSDSIIPKGRVINVRRRLSGSGSGDPGGPPADRHHLADHCAQGGNYALPELFRWEPLMAKRSTSCVPDHSLGVKNLSKSLRRSTIPLLGGPAEIISRGSFTYPLSRNLIALTHQLDSTTTSASDEPRILPQRRMKFFAGIAQEAEKISGRQFPEGSALGFITARLD
jgi:hypothetical protein